MITQIQQDIEDMMYKALDGIGIKAITKYPDQPIESMAITLTEGMMSFYVGKVLESLGDVDYSAMCKAAFKAAILRQLKEAKERK